MYLLFEQGGKFHGGRLLSESESSAQVELPSGKRVKLKQSEMLLRFAAPSPDELLGQAQAQQDGIDLDLLWECATNEEQGFAELAQSYFGASTNTAQQAAMLLRLHGAPHYFQRRGRGMFRKAPQENVQAALKALARKAEEQRQVQAWSQQLVQGEFPAELRSQLWQLLWKPDKNSVGWRAFRQAMLESKQGALALLRQCGALTSAYDFHMQRFLLECYPKGTDFAPALQSQSAPDADEAEAIAALPLAEVEAFSVDDSSTTEIDDAFSVQWLTDDVVRVGVHIAAPGLGVTHGSKLDLTARARLSTAYFPGEKITMLPDALIARYSLDAGRECPALSLYLDFAPQQAEPHAIETRAERVRIRSNLRHDELDARLSVALLEGKAPDAQVPHLAELCVLWRIAQLLRQGREQVRGKPEPTGRQDYTFRLEGVRTAAPSALAHAGNAAANPAQSPSELDDGRRVFIVPRQRDAPLDILVAEWMILTNRLWGAWLHDKGVAAIYRVQSGWGARMKTRMSAQGGAHQGLGVRHYAWCTSPLRRYSDLVNQRQLLACAQHGVAGAMQAPLKPGAAELAAIIASFETTYAAYAEAQRELERYWCLRYVAQQGLQQFEARVLRDGLVRLQGVPLVLNCAATASLPRGALVLVEWLSHDLFSLEVELRLLKVLSEASGAQAAEEEAEEETAAALPVTLALEADVSEATDTTQASQTNPSAAPTEAVSAEVTSL